MLIESATNNENAQCLLNTKVPRGDPGNHFHRNVRTKV
jgi:hypothetical protein